MKLEGEYTFNGPREEVWKLVRDPDVLATALPGTQSLTKISDQEFEGAMNLHIGPVSGVFAGKVLVSDEVPPKSCTLTADGKGSAGFGKGTGHIVLEEAGDGKTLMRYEGDFTVGGKLASVGQRSLDTVSKSMVRQGLIALDKALEARVAAQAENKPLEYTPPSEAQFAAAVAKDVAKDVTKEAMSTAEVRMILYVIPAMIILGIIAFILSRLSGG